VARRNFVYPVEHGDWVVISDEDCRFVMTDAEFREAYTLAETDDEGPMFTLEEQALLRRVVDNELGYLQDNRRRTELSERRKIKPSRREQVAQAVADKLSITTLPGPITWALNLLEAHAIPLVAEGEDERT
jgi:hypothetical protein